MSVWTIAPDETAPLNRRLQAIMGVQQVLTRLHVLPRSEDVHTKVSYAKRHGMTSAGFMVPAPRTDVTTEDAATPSGIPLRIYLPPTGTPPSDIAILYVHGGGFTVGSPESADWLSRELAAHGHPVISVDYRLSPETPYPGPLDDVLEGLVWLDQHRDRFGAKRIALAGDSAGGNLAAGACVRVARDGGPTISHQVLLYPGLDGTFSSPSLHLPTKGLTLRDAEVSFRNYAAHVDPTDPVVSPLLAPDVSGLPPAVILTGEHDVLRDDGRLYAERLVAAGVPVFFRQLPGMPHGFLSMPKLADGQAERAIADVARCLAG